MSKIIYRKVRTAPGLKLTDANWNANAAATWPGTSVRMAHPIRWML